MAASSNISTYAQCVDALRTSLSHVQSSVSILDSAVSDLPRLSSVLKTVRHYELIPQPTLAAAEASLRDEISPAVSTLLDRAERQVERQARRIETLKARAELQQGRLSTATAAPGTDEDGDEDDGSAMRRRRGGKQQTQSGPASRGGGALTGEARLRAVAVRQRKEALKYGVERLELEVLQKQRELRKQLDGA